MSLCSAWSEKVGVHFFAWCLVELSTRSCYEPPLQSAYQQSAVVLFVCVAADLGLALATQVV